MRIHVVADEADRDGGFVLERLVQRGGEIVYLDRADLPVFADLDEFSLLVLLGSARGAHEPGNAEVVARESALARAAGPRPSRCRAPSPTRAPTPSER